MRSANIFSMTVMALCVMSAVGLQEPVGRGRVFFFRAWVVGLDGDDEGFETRGGPTLKLAADRLTGPDGGLS